MSGLPRPESTVELYLAAILARLERLERSRDVVEPRRRRRTVKGGDGGVDG